ncbi:two-component sensor histidine kinase [Streptomyces fagopyri]|uniref:Two-component sensor histidine kinase n=1 Tax=Streptomyces fagopyri TaxID=2662397 RepID=A0A5Q0LDD1_9ACTN|nr:histidine kinase [Streptomyces fagopyri]QFZ74547.1 two-component sensor histidine kinase [Streptomyces fagopyri]
MNTRRTPPPWLPPAPRQSRPGTRTRPDARTGRPGASRGHSRTPPGRLWARLVGPWAPERPASPAGHPEAGAAGAAGPAGGTATPTRRGPDGEARQRASNWPGGAGPGYLADDAPAPGSVRLQLNALQALCRQAFAVRLAAIAIGAPFAMANATDGLSRYTVLAAAVLGVMGSYAMLRDWDRFGPRLLAHPTLMAVDLAFGAVLLLTASPASPLAYATVCTPLLAGLLYGWRGSGVFTGLQLIVLVTVYRAWQHHPGAGANTLLVAGFCVGAGIIGVTLRNLMFRFGTASQALSEANSRLAVAEAVESERARLAREMHDSVAKTLHGLALAAEALAASASADGADPGTLKRQASTVAGAARRAAAESRDLLSDLRHHTDLTSAGTDILSELDHVVASFEARTHLTTELRHHGDRPVLSYATARHVLAIVSEALENTHRHAHAKAVTVEVEPRTQESEFVVRVRDDGVGPPPGAALGDLTRTGHFGLLGMTERAASLGGRIDLNRSEHGGAEVRLTLPLAPAPPHTPQEEAAHA